MATCTLLVATPTDANLTDYASGSFTPAAGDLLVACVTTAGNTEDGTLTDSQSLGWTLVATVLWAASARKLRYYVSNKLAAASSMTISLNVPAGALGANLMVTGVSGLARCGPSAIRQHAEAPNIVANDPCTASFAAATLAGNPTLGWVAASINPPAITPPTDWTEPTSPSGDIGHNAPTNGLEHCLRDSGYAGTAMTWGANPTAAFCVAILELDASPRVFVVS